MDHSSAADGSSDLATFLANFDALSTKDKTKALQHIIRQRRGETTKIPDSIAQPSSLPSTVQDAHSCHICQWLVLTRRPLNEILPHSIRNDGDERSYFNTIDVDGSERFDSNDVVLTKETLQQGIAQKCVLVEWLFTLLARGLLDLKTIVAKTASLPPQLETIRDVTEDLQYISSEGVVISCYGIGSDESDEVILGLSYEIDPFIIDKTWNAANNVDRGWSFEAFASRYGGRLAAHFRISAAADDPAAATIHFRPTVQKTDPDKSLALARTFLDNCQTNHERCFRRTTTLPSRVIDVGTRYPIRSVHLHWSEENEMGQYAALSYCWGGQQPLTTTSDTAQDITNGLLFSDLPRTLQDAMTVTLKLGLRYIWIDSLCIIQDDQEDLSREIASMADTYQGASVTISAASSASVNDGFISNHKTVSHTRVKLPFQSSTVKDGTILLEQAGRLAYNPAEDPINLRAWTLQEHILPRRMLIFGNRQLWWTCESAISFDALPRKLITNVPAVQRKSGNDRYSLDYWRSIVCDYTRRFLTYPNDKLPAIAGVAQLYSQFFNSKYLAGLWEFALLPELMWCSTRSDITRPLARRAPSWSWASIDGEVHHNWCPLDPGPDAPKVVACHIVPVSESSPFGPIDTNRCVLHLEGRLIKAFWHADGRYISTVHTRHMRLNAHTGKDEEMEVPSRAGRVHADALEDETPKEVWILPITSKPIRGLLLAQVEGNTYRRVGLVLRLFKEILGSEDNEVRMVSII